MGWQISGLETSVALPLAVMEISKGFSTWGVDRGYGGKIVGDMGFWGDV